MSGRYVKVKFSSNWGDTVLVLLDELHVCDADGVKWNDETMPHTCRVDYMGSPSYCSSNDPDYWQTFVSDLPNWWKVDLGQSRLISKVKVKALAGYPERLIKDFTVEVSDDDDSSTEILSAQTLQNDSEQTFNTTDGAGPETVTPPVVALTVTPHAPTAWTQTVIIPAVLLVLTACVPNVLIPIAFVPVTPLTLSAPQNTETGDIVSLLNFNDPPGGEVVSDETGRSWTVPHPVVPTETLYPNNAEVSDDGPLAGMGSLSLPSSISYIKTPFTANLDIGSQDFTFECWHKCIDIPNSMAAFFCNDSGTPTPVENGLHIDGSGGYASALLGFTDDTYVYLDEIQPLRAEWKHFAVSRRGNTVYGFDHGVKTVTEVIDPASNGILNQPLNGFVIGASLGYASGLINGMSFFGNISGVQLTVGHGKWIDDFTPPIAPTEYGGESFRGYARSQAPVADLVLSRHDPSYFFLFASHPPAVSLLLTSRNPSAVWELNAAMFPASQVIYLCTLTGAADGVADVLIPISSFQATLRNGEPSYLACVIPNSTDWEDAVTARQNGEIVIQKGYRLADGSLNMEEIARVNFETLRIDRGARNDSATIVGHKTVTATAPKEWAVQGVSYYALQADGKRRIRAAIDLFLRPGDVVIYGDGEADSFIVGSISYSIYVNYAIMEVAEA